MMIAKPIRAYASNGVRLPNSQVKMLILPIAITSYPTLPFLLAYPKIPECRAVDSFQALAPKVSLVRQRPKNSNSNLRRRARALRAILKVGECQYALHRFLLR